MKKIAILGASGYTGRELIKSLLKNNNIVIKHLISENNANKYVFELFPELRNLINLKFEKYNLDNIKNDSDIIFLALPHGTSQKFIKEFYSNKKIIIDLSADFRIQNKNIYETWYKTEHISPEILKESTYGLPEINRKNIKNTKFIANPGCYATSIIIPLYPLLKENIIDENIIINSISGVSGAGKKLSNKYLYNEQNENFLPYNPGKHRHIPEIIEFLKEKTNISIRLTFVPHLAPFTQGILSTIYVKPLKKINHIDITKIYNKYYKDEFFIRILPEKIFPNIKQIKNTNFCDIGFTYIEDQNVLIIFSTIDNLIKGASGQAIQNMNIILGIDEKICLI